MASPKMTVCRAVGPYVCSLSLAAVPALVNRPEGPPLVNEHPDDAGGRALSEIGTMLDARVHEVLLQVAGPGKPDDVFDDELVLRLVPTRTRRVPARLVHKPRVLEMAEDDADLALTADLQ